MKTPFACLALLCAVAALIVIDSHYPHVLSPQTYGLLLIAAAITLVIQLARVKPSFKSRHPHTG